MNAHGSRYLGGRRFAALVGCLGFLLIGWSSLVVPALATHIERSYGQSDAGLGLYYLINAAAYALGSVLGGMVTERAGRRRVFVTAAALHGLGLLVQAGTGLWLVFVLAGILRGLGTGAIDGGVNGLVLDLYPGSRGRALNMAHLFFALGALGSPIAIGALSEAAVPWGAIVAATGLASLPLGVGFAVADLRDGRRRGVKVPGETARTDRRGLLSLPVLALAAAIAFYVASEMGVSNWLVRFLASAPIVVADAALGLFWGGLTLGRLVSAALADRFDHLTLAVVASIVSGLALCAAVAVPSLPASVALFAVVGFAFGPVYPLIMAVGGEQFPDRAAAVSGVLGGAAVAGTIVYPPLMGVLSVTVGLPAAMLGTGVIALAGAVMLVAAGGAIKRHRAAGELAVAQETAGG